jgi:hypothetical protein
VTHFARTLMLCAALAGAALISGCNSGGDSSGAMVRTGTVPVRTTPSGRLTSEPSPLTLADVGRFPVGSAQRAVMQLLFWGQWGNLPAVAASYDARVVQHLGESTLRETYDWLASSLVATRPLIAGARRSGPYTFVAVELLTKDNPPTHDSFLLRPVAGGWSVVYDTVLDRALNGYTTQRVAADPNHPSARAQRAGAAAAKAYRDLAPTLAAPRARKRGRH